MIPLISSFAALALPQGTPAKPPADAPPARFAPIANNAAWGRLPREAPPLPVWARTTVVPLPKATAGVLALDYLHRAKNPLGAELAAKVRWAVASELGCVYAAQYAESDLRRMGTSDAELADLRKGEVSPTDRMVLKFARKLTAAGYSLTDAEMKAIIDRLGPDRAVALVHTVAYANFHDRILLALGVEVEKDGPYPPVDFKYDVTQSALADAPARPAWDTVKDLVPKSTYGAPADWKDVGYDALEQSLQSQQARSARIAIPGKSRFEKLPPDVKMQTDKIVWMQVSAGYQPDMTMAWFAAYRGYQQEGKQNPVFGSTVFWIVTRANDCFY